jgi:hypothetical protein
MRAFVLSALVIALPTLSGCGDGSEAQSVSASGGGLPTITITASGGSNGGSGGTDSDTDGGDTDTDSGAASASSSDSNGADNSFKYDVAAPSWDTSDTGDDPCEDTGDDCVCTIPDHVPCDGGTNDPFQAMGLNCPGELQVQASTMGSGSAIGVRTSFGANATFNPREGSKYAVIGSGLVGDLDLQTPGGDSNTQPTHCNDDLKIGLGKNLPAPLKPNAVVGDCTQDLGLIGTGDCSGTIQGQFNQGGSANDYTELRFVLDVPVDVTSFSYDFAFFSTEWPYYYGSKYNDMYVGWLESELWTGNISFDMQGNPISLNAGFLDFQDQGGNLPEFAGTCMRQHAGTNWLTSTVGVSPGEQITVVFAIFDLSDGILDSYAFLDNFQWGCEPSGKPQTIPG